jgi:Fe2+ or Zn2+ uptake regulation protein
MDELDGCIAEKFEAIARDHGYTQISHVFEIYGVCEKCSTRPQPAPKP